MNQYNKLIKQLNLLKRNFSYAFLFVVFIPVLAYSIIQYHSSIPENGTWKNGRFNVFLLPLAILIIDIVCYVLFYRNAMIQNRAIIIEIQKELESISLESIDSSDKS